MAFLHVHTVEYFKISTGELPSEPGILGLLHLDLVRPSPTLIVENWLCKVARGKACSRSSRTTAVLPSRWEMCLVLGSSCCGLSLALSVIRYMAGHGKGLVLDASFASLRIFFPGHIDLQQSKRLASYYIFPDFDTLPPETYSHRHT